MRTSGDLALVDTNVLVASLFADHVHHARSRALLDRLQIGDAALCITPQVLAECFSVITDPRRVTAPRSAAEALDAIDAFVTMPGMVVLPVPSDVVARWVALARRRPVTRGRIYDVQLAATMLGNSVRRIYTHNRSDFEHIDGVDVLDP